MIQLALVYTALREGGLDDVLLVNRTTFKQPLELAAGYGFDLVF